jgi:plasmid stabilization system protein ParE
MSESQGFALHPLAAQDITDIWEFIAEHNPLAVRPVREDILDAIRVLVPFPHQGQEWSDLTSPPLRFKTVHDYLIAYAPDERPLLVIVVLHGPPQPSRYGCDSSGEGLDVWIHCVPCWSSRNPPRFNDRG